jgi:hypothetical protein
MNGRLPRFVFFLAIGFLSIPLVTAQLTRPQPARGPSSELQQPAVQSPSVQLAQAISGHANSRPKLDYQRDIRPILSASCLRCHNEDDPNGGIYFDGDDIGAASSAAAWKRVAAQLHHNTMPPPGETQIVASDRLTLLRWCTQALAGSDSGESAVGHVTVRRLNRGEYSRTVRELLGIDLHPANSFPADDTGYGFDTIGDVLSTPPILVEKYLAAAAQLIDAAFADSSARERLLNPPTNDPALLAYRGIVEPVRDEARKSFRRAPAAAAAPDPRSEELARAYNCLRAFTDRAWRRPARQEELTRLLRFVEAAQKNDAGWERGLAAALKAILVSPAFLYRFELDDAGTANRSVRDLGDFELASRLSYFLWSSLPDDELYNLAAKQALRNSEVLSQQVSRMLHDSRSAALAEEFAPQWLHIRGLQDIQPDPQQFPDFDEALRAAMMREPVLCFQAIVQEDRSILDLLAADYSFVNERLAKHYRIAGVKGDEFHRSEVSANRCGGVLFQAGVLALNSNPTRTSPVKRGKWILDNLLGTPPPAAPANVPDLPESNSAAHATLRERMQRHRTDPACASCHARMDPLGFGLENFDAIGAWRTKEGTQPIDASGSLPDGSHFSGPDELQALLRGKSAEFARCLTEKLFTYALGRGVEPADYLTIDEIVEQLRQNDFRFSTLVQAIVASDAFRMRTSERAIP